MNCKIKSKAIKASKEKYKPIGRPTLENCH
jgi:hypothetical protein